MSNWARRKKKRKKGECGGGGKESSLKTWKSQTVSRGLFSQYRWLRDRCMLGVRFKENENDEMRQSHTCVSPCSHGYASKTKPR